MLSITGGYATFNRADGILRATGSVTIKNEGKKEAMIVRMGTETHLLLNTELVGSSGGAVSKFGSLKPGNTRDMQFSIGVGSAAVNDIEPLRTLLHVGCRIEFTEDDGATVEDVNIWSSASGMLVEKSMDKPMASINRPTGDLYSISFDEG